MFCKPAFRVGVLALACLVVTPILACTGGSSTTPGPISSQGSLPGTSSPGTGESPATLMPSPTRMTPLRPTPTPRSIPSTGTSPAPSPTQIPRVSPRATAIAVAGRDSTPIPLPTTQSGQAATSNPTAIPADMPTPMPTPIPEATIDSFTNSQASGEYFIALLQLFILVFEPAG